MKSAFVLLLALLLSRSAAVSATLDQFLPWLSPNSLAFGTSFDDFKKIRPTAINLAELDISGRGVVPKRPYEGDFIEKMPDRSYFNYIFLNDKFAASSWGTPASSETARLLLTVRNSLLKTCGEPTFGTSGRIKTQGGIARIVWEQYRPRMDPNYQITLKATSESGIEVELINVMVANQRSIKTVPPTYEEVVQSLPLSVQTSEPTGALVDLLDEARSGSFTTVPEFPEPKRGNNEPANANQQAQGPRTAPETKSALSTSSEESASSTTWSIIVVLVLAAVGLLWWLLKRRS